MARLPVLAPAGVRPAAPPPPPRRRPRRRHTGRVRPGHLPLRPGRPHARARRRPHGRRHQVGPRRRHRSGGRPDVLTCTTPALDKDVEVVGEVSAEIWFRYSLPYADVFVRLCDVDEKGRSTNVCDGLINLTGADDTTCAKVRLWPTSYRFQRGHRIRVQISSGAFPRYNRNLGTGEPQATATTLNDPADRTTELTKPGGPLEH
ncbi:CocE/NonD family hydrolase [Streptomyces sp. NPDC048504]|uniref:CocE/NonD family hydrolase n=1 Tax=Streptomyces sp. NPDC048504 TaxID=3365559 RepID=UPI0037181EF0